MRSSSDHPIRREGVFSFAPSLDESGALRRISFTVVGLLVRCLGILLFVTGYWHVMEAASAVLPIRMGLKEAESWLRLIVSPLQMVLGLGLLLRPEMRMLNLGALVLFILFSTYQLIHWLIDGSPCDCLVIAKVAPIWMWSLDFVAMLALATHLYFLRSTQPQALGFLGLRLGVINLAILLAIVGISTLGPRWITAMERVELVRGTDLLEPVLADGTRQLRFVTIRNRSSQPVALHGGTAHCACTVLAGLPLTIPAWQSAPIPVLVRATRAAETSRVQVEFFTDFPRQPKLAGALYFRSVPIEKETSS